MPRPIGEVFAFFADARNLDALTPPWLRFTILSPLPIEMRTGARIDYRLRIRGVSVRWQSEITVWDPPHRFVDEQRSGPYAWWRHEHTFVATGGRTAVLDAVSYRAPGGILEPLIHWLFVRRDLERVFAYRHERLAERYGLPHASASAERWIALS